MTKHKQIHVKKLETRFPPRFPGHKPLPDGWKNSVKGCHADAQKPGLHIMDVEHVSPEVTKLHNDPESSQSVMTLYRKKVCVHNCPSCFNEDAAVYGRVRGGKQNKMLSLAQTMDVIDHARKIANSEGHKFEAVKFLGPGELLIKATEETHAASCGVYLIRSLLPKLGRCKQRGIRPNLGMNPELFKIIEPYLPVS